MSDRAKSHMGGSKSKKSTSGEKAHSMHIKRGKSGGFVVIHHKKRPDNGLGQGDDDPHVIADMDALHNHLDDQMGDQPPAGTPPEEPQPAPQAAPAPMGM